MDYYVVWVLYVVTENMSGTFWGGGGICLLFGIINDLCDNVCGSGCHGVLGWWISYRRCHGNLHGWGTDCCCVSRGKAPWHFLVRSTSLLSVWTKLDFKISVFLHFCCWTFTLSTFFLKKFSLKWEQTACKSKKQKSEARMTGSMSETRSKHRKGLKIIVYLLLECNWCIGN